MTTRGFSVNNHDRNDVVAFWHAVYQASEGYENRIKWTGNYNGNNGTVAEAFVGDVERRINYFRAMSGLKSDTEVSADSTVVIESTDAYKPSSSTRKSQAAQDAALMLVRNYNSSTGSNPALTHQPPSNLVGWSSTSWNASAKGNFAFGIYGPGAITEYMIEELSRSAVVSQWNSLVGHRRWNLYPRATRFATGDQPGESAKRPPSNVLYVLQKDSELAEEVASNFVAYPPAGYFPAPINSRFWSLSREGANFSAATVTMTDAAGNRVPILAVRPSNHYGDPAIIWEVSGGTAAQTVKSDTTFHVQVSGISGENVPANLDYAVTLIDPEVLTCPQKLVGSSSQSSKGQNHYDVSKVSGAEETQIVAFLRSAARWVENAEVPDKAQVIDHTGKNYNLLVKAGDYSGFGGLTGKSSFQLTFPTSYDLVHRGIPDQIFEIDRDFIANPKSEVTFKYRRGFMTLNSYLVVEGSKDGGITWKSLGGAIRGASNTKLSYSISTAKFAIPQSSHPQRLRFRYYTKGGAIYTHEAAPKSPTGIFIDEITTRNCDELTPKKKNNYIGSVESFAFSNLTSGSKLVPGEKWSLRLRSKVGGKWFPYGPAKSVTITAK